MATPEQNAKMARMMKDKKVERKSGRCPICNQTINLNQVQNHIGMHK